MSSPSSRSDDDNEDGDLLEELENRAEEALNDGEFVSFEDHVDSRED